jgi:hypothetical protein
MYMRLGFAVAAHLAADVLLLDEVFAVGDEAFQRKCFAKIAEFKQRGGTILFVSHDAAAVERLCERAVLLRGGEVELDGPTHDAIARYHRLLAAERDPAEREVGLREWGSGEAHLAGVRLEDPEGDERVQLLAGEPVALRLTVVAERPLPPPTLAVELRTEGGILLSRSLQDLAPLGWDEAAPRLGLRLDVDSLPLAEGRFRLRLSLVDATGELTYHHLDDAASFVVHPAGEERGPVRLEGRWSREEIAAAAELRVR